MDNILNFNFQTQIIETLGYFSCELFFVLGIILNLFFFIFLKRKLNIKRVSDFLTAGVFGVNLLILSGFLIKNLYFSNFQEEYFLNDIFVFNNIVIVLKLFINFFMLAFLLITYRLTRKTSYNIPIINSFLLFCALLSSFLVCAQSYILAYILLDILTVAIYKYASFIFSRGIYPEI